MARWRSAIDWNLSPAGLVVTAKDLGKTCLAAFDSARGEYKRLLFVTHREEILRQAIAGDRRRVEESGPDGCGASEPEEIREISVFSIRSGATSPLA